MKKTIGYFLGRSIPAVLLVFLMHGCDLRNQDAGSQGTTSYEEEEAIPCVRVAQVGDLDACLPEMEGMDECREHPIIDSFLKVISGPSQVTFGYYLSDSDYAMIDSLRGLAYHDYAMLYTVETFLNMRFSPHDLDDIVEQMSAGMNEERWESVKEKLNEIRDDMEYKQIFLLEKYTAGPNLRCMVFLVQSRSGDMDEMHLMLNCPMVVNNRLVYLGYYVPGTNEMSLEADKARAERFAKAFLAANP